MALKFTNVGENWVAEFSVTDDFNLHIEREESGYLIVNQRTTAEGKYDSIRDGSFNYGDPVVDIDFTGVIYPKYIQVISKVEPTYAEVTSNGEVKQAGGIKKSSFYLNGEHKKYDYEEGMTWGEWIDSPYNDGNFSVHDANMGEGIQEYVHYEYSVITDNEYYYVKPTDLIQPDINYSVNNEVR